MSGVLVLACVSPGRSGDRDVLRMENGEFTQKLTYRFGVMHTFNLNTQEGGQGPICSPLLMWPLYEKPLRYAAAESLHSSFPTMMG